MNQHWLSFFDQDNPSHYINLKTIAKLKLKSNSQLLNEFLQKKIQNFYRDSLLEKTLKLIPVFSPFHAGKMIWDIIILFCLISLLFIYLLQFAFGFSSSKAINTYFTTTCQLMVYFDILVNLNTGIYHNGVISTDRKQIYRNYIKENLFSGIFVNFLIFIHQVTRASDQLESAYNLSQTYNAYDVILICFLVKIG